MNYTRSIAGTMTAPRRRPFSLKTLFLIVTVVAAGSFWVTWRPSSSQIAAFKTNPLSCPNVAFWLASLTSRQQRAFAKEIGTVLLESPNRGSDFVFGFGAESSPYPWVIHAGDHGIILTEGNSFELVLRDDAWVKGTWGPYWNYQQSYEAHRTFAGIEFTKTPADQKAKKGDLWIAATSWRYVGPVLNKSNRILGRNPISGSSY